MIAVNFLVKSSIAKIIWDTRTPRTIRARADFTIKAIIINHYVMTKMTMVVIFSDLCRVLERKTNILIPT